MSLKTDLKAMTGADDAYLDIMIPILIDLANNETNRDYTELDLPHGIKLFIAKAIEYNKTQGGLQARSMGSVSYTYDTDFPNSIMSLLKPYKRIRVLFYD